MKKLIIKLSYILLPVLTFILWTITFLLSELYRTVPSELFWLPCGAIQILISLACGLLIKKLNYAANNDVLTGLYNRRQFNNSLSEELSRVKRTKSTLSLILIDIDNFKSVNDTYGHLKGDEVLKKLGYILKSSARTIDFAARWGGEEFAIILPETDLNGAEVFAERLRKNVENYDFGKFQVTISLGIVSTSDELSLDELLTKADEALYAAKAKKNMVIAYRRKHELVSEVREVF